MLNQLDQWDKTYDEGGITLFKNTFLMGFGWMVIEGEIKLEDKGDDFEISVQLQYNGTLTLLSPKQNYPLPIIAKDLQSINSLIFSLLMETDGPIHSYIPTGNSRLS